jgi:hypothetical protein
MDYLTADGKPSAHFEHDIALVDGKRNISTFAYIYQALGIVSNEVRSLESKVPFVISITYPFNQISVPLNEKNFSNSF